MGRELFGRIPMAHPVFATAWAEERQKWKVPLDD